MQNQAKHIIELKSSFKIEDLPKAKLQQHFDNGVVTELEVPTCDGSFFEGRPA